MPNLADHHAGKIVKLLYMGDSGTGKSGSLVSLVAAGYKLHILDLDNGLDVLVAYIKKECPDKITNVDYESVRDKIKSTPMGPAIQGVAKAYVKSLDLMTKWSDGSIPSEWGPEHIFVMDSLTGLGRAGYDWAKSINPMAKEPRTWYFAAQQACGQVLSLLTNDEFKANVIVIAHVNFQTSPDGSMRGYPNSIGQAFNPDIPTFFNNIVLSRSSGSGVNVKRSIVTVPTSMIDLKSSAPFRVDQELPLGTGLATLFSKLKETN